MLCIWLFVVQKYVMDSPGMFEILVLNSKCFQFYIWNVWAMINGAINLIIYEAYSLRPKKWCKSRFSRSQIILILTKFIENSIKIYVTKNIIRLIMYYIFILNLFRYINVSNFLYINLVKFKIVWLLEK